MLASRRHLLQQDTRARLSSSVCGLASGVDVGSWAPVSTCHPSFTPMFSRIVAGTCVMPYRLAVDTWAEKALSIRGECPLALPHTLGVHNFSISSSRSSD